VIHSWIFWTFVAEAAVAIFVSPTIIALIRHVDQIELVVLFNALSLITGVSWIGAMLLACGLPRRLPPQPKYFIPPVATPVRSWPVVESANAGYWRAADRSWMYAREHR
jgi:hypothetical protein